MDKALRVGFVLLALSTAGRARGQGCAPPPNEACAGATAFSFDQLPLDVAGLLGCVNNMVDRPYFDVFYQYDCTVSGDYLFDMCGSLGDTYMRIYTGGCGFFPASSWVEDDDGCGGTPNELDPWITVSLEAGVSYWIELGSWRVDDFFPPNANDPYVFHVEFLGVPDPWTNLGGGTTGSNGAPTLVGDGPLTAGSAMTLDLDSTPPGALVLGWVSLTSTPQDFFGGTIHPLPIASEFLFSADASGALTLAGTWPPGFSPGTCVWFQFLVQDAGVLGNITLSNAVKAATP